MATIASLDVGMNLESARYTKGLSRAQRNTRKTARAIRAHLASMSQSFTRVVRNVGLLGLAIGGLVFTGIVKVTASLEDMRTVLQSITGNAREAFAFLAKLSTSTQFGIEDLFGVFLKLQTAGIKPTVALFTTFTDTAANSSDQLGTLTALADLFSRTISGGLGLIDLNRLADRGVPAFRILEEQLGLTRLQISQFGKTAEGAQRIRDALVLGLNELNSGATASRLGNLSTLFSNLNIAIRLAANQVGEGFSPALKSITTRITNFVTGGEGQLRGLGLSLNDILLKVDAFLADFFTNFDDNLAKVIAGISDFVDGFLTIAAVFKGIFSVFKLMLDAFNFLRELLGDTVLKIAGFIAAILLISVPAVAIAGAVTTISVGVYALGTALVGLAVTFIPPAIAALGALYVALLPILIPLGLIVGAIAVAVTAFAGIGISLGILSNDSASAKDQIIEFGSAIARVYRERGLFAAATEVIKAAFRGFLDFFTIKILELHSFLLRSIKTITELQVSAFEFFNLSPPETLLNFINSLNDALAIMQDRISAIRNGPTLGGRIDADSDSRRPRVLGSGFSDAASRGTLALQSTEGIKIRVTTVSPEAAKSLASIRSGIPGTRISPAVFDLPDLNVRGITSAFESVGIEVNKAGGLADASAAQLRRYAPIAERILLYQERLNSLAPEDLRNRELYQNALIEAGKQARDIFAPTTQAFDATAAAAKEFSATFSDNLKAGFRAIINGTDNLINVLVSSFTKSLGDLLIDRAFSGLTDKFAGDLFSTFAGSFDTFGGGDGGARATIGSGVISPSNARALGGPVLSGGQYLVGERGPEIFSPNGDGQIIPNNRMSAFLSGQGDINLTVNNSIVGNLDNEMRRFLGQNAIEIANTVAAVDSERG